MFRNRTEAARQLADVLTTHDLAADVVLAIPRGGVPVGRVVADRLAAPLDVVVARKLTPPDQEEFAIGAVTADGTVWLDEPTVDRLQIDDDYLDGEILREQTRARETAERYRRRRPNIDLDGRDTVIVDDGVATGATVEASVRAVEESGASSVTVAVPVGPPDALERLRTVADEVICVESPPHFRAVGQFYDTFGQVSDDDALACLDSESGPRSPAQ